jgi:hypothetical protein
MTALNFPSRRGEARQKSIILSPSSVSEAGHMAPSVKIWSIIFSKVSSISFPNIVKYMFWASEHSTGIFEPLNLEDLAKYKRMSKYKKDEIAA